MTRKILVSLILGVVSLFALVSVYSQSDRDLFRDKQGRFTVAIPQGWTADLLDENTVQIEAHPGYVTILALQTTASAQDICSQLMAQMYSQWQGLELVREGRITLSGRPAYAVVFTGKNPRGVDSALRIIGMSLGQRGLALMFSVPADRFAVFKPALDNIEQSFSVSGADGGTTGAGGGALAGPAQQRPAQPMAQLPRGGIPAFRLKAGFCTAVAPADWIVSGILPDGKGASLRSNATSFSGVYTIEGVTAEFIQLAKPYCADPRVCVQHKVADSVQSVGLGPVLNMSQIQQYGDMFVQEFETPTRHLVAMYSFYPMALGGYVLVFRMADGPREHWQSHGTAAILVAGSIRCQAQYRSSPSEDLGSRREASGVSNYNVQLGTEYAHDPETGETFFMKHASDWMETGPDGPGYYRQIPGGYRKLAPGLSE